ncbi:MAG: hypothetical protein PQJ58_02640 [Spirochaetales bacterium]|nr:hypothetical protein [Spirochaetales bacterium]
MKQRVLLLIMILTGATALSAAPLVPFTFGAAFPNYENSYMLVGTGVYFPMGNNLELSLTGAFGIRTEDDGNEVKANFFYPLSGGVNFLFPVNTNLTFVTGTGFAAQMQFADDFTFHMGPYVKGGVRYRVHKNMQLSLELQQDLMFGPPQWINTTTQINGGIVCNF